MSYVKKAAWNRRARSTSPADTTKNVNVSQAIKEDTRQQSTTLQDTSMVEPSCLLTRELSGKSLAIEEGRNKKRTQSFKRIYEKGMQLKSKVRNNAHLLQMNEQAEFEAMKPD